MKKIYFSLFFLWFSVYGFAAEYVVTNNNSSGEGSLWYGIQYSNDGDNIIFNLPEGNETIISYTDMSITTNISIDGSNNAGSGVNITVRVTLPGSTQLRVFSIYNGKTVSISNMTIRGGNISGNGDIGSGFGGGIYISNGTLNLNNVTISSSKAYKGGGIYNSFQGTLNITNSTITGNQAYAISDLEEIYGLGGGVYNENICTIQNSTITSNSIYAENSYVEALDVYAYGGGICNYSGTMTIENSTITDNIAQAESNGGASIDVQGGGVYNEANIIVVSTLIGNNILEDNGSVNNDFCHNGSSVTDNGYNIVEYSTYYTWSGTGDITGNQPNLFGTGQATQTLADNGGPTQTLALESGSVALAAGTWDASITTDQRGTTRHQYYPSIGAYEPLNYGQSWTGTSSSSWEETGNWSPGAIPTVNDDITIPEVSSRASEAIIAADETADCNDLLISSGGSLTIQSSSSGTGSLIIGGTLSNSGSITSQCYLPGSAQAWHMVSGPAVVDISDNNWNPGGSDDFFAWSEPSPGYWVNYKVTSGDLNFPDYNGSDNFVAGRGYLLAYNSGNPTKEWDGTLNTGTITFQLANSATDRSWTYKEGWNLMGNPYSSSIDWNEVDHTASSLFQDVYAYMYDPDFGGSGGYVYVNGSTANAYIPPHQGFFVLAKQASNGQNFSFTSAMQTHGNGSNIHKEKELSNSLKIRLANEQFFDECLIYLSENSTWERDPYDALKMFSFNSDAPQLFSISNNEVNLAVNGIPEIETQKHLPLGIKIPVEETFIFSMEHSAGIFEAELIFLEDKQNGTFHNLNTSEYIFVSEEGEITDRFVLHIGSTGIEEELQNNISSIQFWTNKQSLHIYNPESKTGRIQLINMLGQTLLSTELTNEINQEIKLEVESGYYVVRIIGNDFIENAKIYVE